jgi:putative phosphoribosyl transferase
VFKNRQDAGRKLAARLSHLRGRRPVVLALPRGGVPVAREIALELGCPLDLVIVRKIGAPQQPELAVGAVVGGAVIDTVLNEEVCRAYRVDEAYIARERARALAEIERRRALYLAEWPPLDIRGKTAIVVDDGIATGASMRAALAAVRRADPERLVVAAPVAAPDLIEALETEADEVVIVRVTPHLGSIGEFYEDFHQLEDDEILDLLETSRRPKG